MDIDHDGKITKDEVLKRFTLLDKNGDGAVNRDELMAAFQQPDRRAEDRPGLPLRPQRGRPGRSDRGGPGHFGPRSASEIIQRFDKDHDGSLSKSEVPERLWDRFLSRADADRNGIVTKDDLEAHLKNARANPKADDKKPATGEPAATPKPESEKPAEVKKEEEKPQANRTELDLPADATAVINAA